MKINLLNKLGDFTKKLKQNEEEYMKKYKELVGEDVKYNNTSLDSKSNFKDDYSHQNSNGKNDNFLKMEISNDILNKRDSEITNLVNSITELASIFKDLQTLVMEQG